jgi:hypothetical protein
MLHGGRDMLHGEDAVVAMSAGNLLAAHVRRAHFRFDLGCGKDKKSPQRHLKARHFKSGEQNVRF